MLHGPAAVRPPLPLGLPSGQRRHRDKTNSQFGWMQTRSQQEWNGGNWTKNNVWFKEPITLNALQSSAICLLYTELYHISVMTRAFQMDGFRFICFTDL